MKTWARWLFKCRNEGGSTRRRARQSLACAPLGLSLMFGVLLTASARAELLFEWDFLSSGNGGADLSSNNVAGTSSIGTKENNPTITQGATGLGPLFDPDARFGMMTVGLYTNQGVRTTGSTGQYQDYFGTDANNHFGTGTVAIVYNPGFATLASTVAGEGGKQKPDKAQVLFSAGTFASSTALSLTLRDRLNAGDVQLFLAASGTQSALLNTGTAFVFDTNQWYFVAASWAQNDEATVFIRALTGPNTNTGYFASSTAALTAATGPAAANVAAGFAFTFGNPISGLGDYALVRVFDDYTATQQEYDALYETVVPEPATLSLLAVGGVILWRRRKTE